MTLPEHAWLGRKDCHREAAYEQRCSLVFSDSSSQNTLTLYLLSLSLLKAVTRSLGEEMIILCKKKKEQRRELVLVHYRQLDL